MRDIGVLPLAEYVEWLLAGRFRGEGERGEGLLAPYSASHSVKPYVAYNAALASTSLQEDFRFASLLPAGYRFRTLRFWIGPEGAATPLHSDSWGFNLFFQGFGRKRFLLFEPEQEPCLYPSDVFEFNTVHSRVNVREPDDRKFPRFRQARPIEVILRPGELLVLPRCWWHDVESLDPSISVNAWAVTARDRFTASYLLNRGKKFLHEMGVYKKRRCTCHLAPGRQDLGQILGWY
jgi:hypothetical protein